jgi:DNA-binding PadR family transcriptional regulator/multimeric flavodoxin WrbA
MPRENRTRYAILGFLDLAPMSGYDIRKFSALSLAHFWNEDYGHIYPALRALEKEGLASRATRTSLGRPDRQVYSITPTGRQTLAEWLALDPARPNLRIELLLKVFFASRIGGERLVEMLEAEAGSCRELLAEFAGTEEHPRRKSRQGASVRARRAFNSSACAMASVTTAPCRHGAANRYRKYAPRSEGANKEQTMKIIVLGGSPKGETSVTMQYVRWLEKRYPGHSFDVRQAAARIAALERDPAAFEEIIQAVRAAEVVLWAFPLYVFTVCSQYKRFIELIADRGAGPAFAGKYAASLSTSIHFYDHTAHNYMREVSEDLGLRFVGSFSPKMDDLLRPAGRAQLKDFADELFSVAAAGLACPRRSSALPPPAPVLPDAAAVRRIPFAGKVAVIVDYPERAAGALARRFAAVLDGEVDLIELPSLGIKGGCLGCLRCGQANRCAWEGKDGFIEAFRTRVQTADILVIAGTVIDRAFSARFKAFLDRSFFNTHQRILRGKQFVFLAGGPIASMANLRETLSAWVEWQGSNLVDFVSDQAADPAELGAWIDAAASRAVAAARAHACKPATFLGVAGMKIFRDDIFGELRLVFKADHRAYRRSGEYDFPGRKPFFRLAVWLGYWISSIPGVYHAMIANFPRIMISRFKAVVGAAAAEAHASAGKGAST